MKNGKRWFIALLSSVLLMGIGSLLAQDWPQWRGADRDGRVAGFVAPEVWPETMTPVWKVDVGTGDATPALVEGRLYVFVRQGEEEVLLCLNAGDGKELWRDSYAAQAATGAAARHPGPRSSPAVADGKIVTLGLGGVLSCLDLAGRKVIWRKDPFPGVVPMFYTSMSPMIVDGKCIAHLGSAGEGAIIAYDLNTGEEVWRWSEEGPEYASPVLLTVDGIEQIVTLTEKSIVGIGTADGALLWQLPFLPQRRAYNAATPIVDGRNVIFTGAARGTKAVRVEKRGDGFVAEELWSNPDLSVQFNTPVMKNDLLFGFSNDGSLFCIDARTGHTAWADTTQYGRGGFAAVLDAGPVVMALPNSSDLIVFRPDGERYTELARLKVSDNAVYAHPVIAGNRIFVKDEESLALYTIP